VYFFFGPKDACKEILLGLLAIDPVSRRIAPPFWKLFITKGNYFQQHE
jgi:hypothetical protein